MAENIRQVPKGTIKSQYASFIGDGKPTDGDELVTNPFYGIGITYQDSVTETLYSRIYDNGLASDFAELLDQVGTRKKIYTITEDCQIIPDDADIVNVDITVESSENKNFKIYLPKNPTHLKDIEIFCSHAKRSGITSEKAVDIHRRIDQPNPDQSLYYVYPKQCTIMRYNQLRNSWNYLGAWYCDDGEEID